MPGRGQLLLFAAALAATVASGALDLLEVGAIPTFVASALALALLAGMVSEATDQLGRHVGPGAGGVIQSALGNLPELLVSIFALRQGLDTLVRYSLIGSILSNSLLVLGLSFLVGGFRRGALTFRTEAPRMIATLLVLAVAALTLPTLAAVLHTPAAKHEAVLSTVCAVVLLTVFAASIPSTLRYGQRIPAEEQEEDADPPWSLWTTLAVLGASGVAAALVSDWFTGALKPATTALGLSQGFTGLVIVAIAGNAVEHSVGIVLAARGKGDYAVSVVLNSALQVALVVIPVVVLASWFVTGTVFTLVLPGLLVAAVFFAALLSAVIVFDGRGDTVEGAALVGLYGMMAAAVWWG